MNHLSAKCIRRFGYGVALSSAALANVVTYWQVSFLLGVFLIGLGFGLGNWKWGD